MHLHLTNPPNVRWPAPSPRVRELLRAGAERALNVPAEWLAEMDEATAVHPEPIRGVTDNPVLMAATRRVTRLSLVHWASANIENPGAPVPAYVPPDMLSNARELVRLGAIDLMFNGSRAAQNVAWQHWMEIAFGLTSDAAELRELLDVSARSISAFIDANMERVSVLLRAEREERQRGTHVERRDLATRIVEGAPVDLREAGQRLGYALDQAHHAAVVWSEESEPDIKALEEAARSLADHAGTREMLVVMANAATLWAWVHGARALDLDTLRGTVQGLAGVRMAIGSTGSGIEGFRRAHLEALSTQSVVARLRSPARVVGFDQVRLVAVMTQNAEAANQFARHTLGQLASAEPALRQALLIFLHTGCNATQAAELAHVHRNTFLRRLARAEELLPRPLEHNRIHVAAALEALSWSGGDGA
ncbi:MAG: PucR family transcriptional regulator [Aquabacterium sp.]|jgi:DNA-binding PucR family transcriptional regulator|nr:MAG: PucR family transcriptional regulator [Aquabacterium sp.]TAL23405.1 MAG: PucR family transcriptional regulator [Aquabacterium sp.]